MKKVMFQPTQRHYCKVIRAWVGPANGPYEIPLDLAQRRIRAGLGNIDQPVLGPSEFKKRDPAMEEPDEDDSDSSYVEEAIADLDDETHVEEAIADLDEED